jgi:hypothetical protein
MLNSVYDTGTPHRTSYDTVDGWIELNCVYHMGVRSIAVTKPSLPSSLGVILKIRRPYNLDGRTCISTIDCEWLMKGQMLGYEL